MTDPASADAPAQQSGPGQPDAFPAQPAAVKALQVSCGYMLDFASARALVTDEMIASASHLLRVPPAEASEADEVALRRINKALAAAIQPATVESIRIVRELHLDRHTRPGLIRRWWRDSEARKQIGFAAGLLFVMLILLIAFQVYTLVLSTAVQRINDISQERAAIAAQIEAAKDAARAAGEDWELPDTLKEARSAAALRYEGAYQLLSQWSRPWRRLVVVDAPPDDADEQKAVRQHAVRQAADAVLRALALYVLPLLYGLLGANAYILRAISQHIDNHTFSLLSLYKYRLRLGLGALLGASVSLIFSSDEAATQGIGLSMPAVAFLSGYSVEFAFSIVDALIARGRMAVGGRSAPATAAANEPKA